MPPSDSGSRGAPGNPATTLEGTPGPLYSSAARAEASSHGDPAGPAPAMWPAAGVCSVWCPVMRERSCTAGCGCPVTEFEFDLEGDGRPSQSVRRDVACSSFAQEGC